MYAVEYTWISEPMPVITRIMIADSGSSASANAAVKSPEVIQVNTCWLIVRASGSSATRLQTIASDTTNAPAIAAHASAPAAALLRRRPKAAFSRNPTNGSSGISRSIKRFLPFQLRERIGVERFPIPEQRDDDRQADRSFGGRNGHHKKHDDLPVARSHRPPEGDERQVDGIQHDLDRQQ